MLSVINFYDSQFVWIRSHKNDSRWTDKSLAVSAEVLYGNKTGAAKINVNEDKNVNQCYELVVQLWEHQQDFMGVS